MSRAAVDVYPHEPRTGEEWVNPYRNEPKVVVYPHIGASTQEAQPRIGHRVAHTFHQFSTRGAIRDTVFQPRLTLELSAQATSGADMADGVSVVLFEVRNVVLMRPFMLQGLTTLPLYTRIFLSMVGPMIWHCWINPCLLNNFNKWWKQQSSGSIHAGHSIDSAGGRTIIDSTQVEAIGVEW